jgi:(R,R)-butanediol dehydrogenase/meso-butanediol dehydrogenase/diacetyl reductase
MAASRTMRAAFYQGGRTFTPGTAPVPVPGAREALLRVRRVGICGTDLHIFQGHLDHRVRKGGIIGHETFAEVVQPPQWSDFKAGDRVVVEPLQFCGKCRACRMGASYICYDLKVLGVDLPGGMQEYWAVPGERLLRIPDSIADDDAAVIEPLAVATHDVRRAGVNKGDAVLVFGGGPIGTLIALVCRHRGARVAVAEINPFRVEMLGTLGLQTVGAGADVVRFAEAWTDGAGVDVAFEVTGNPAAVLLMTDVVRVWGTVSLVAIHAEPMPVNLYRMFARELTMHGSRLYAREDWEEAIRLAASGAVPLGPLVSRRIPLEALQDGMEQALAGGPVMKVLVDLTA